MVLYLWKEKKKKADSSSMHIPRQPPRVREKAAAKGTQLRLVLIQKHINIKGQDCGDMVGDPISKAYGPHC